MTGVKKKSPPTLSRKPAPGTMIKPGELIDIVETTPLTLADRRTYNLLIANAFHALGDHREHEISLATLKEFDAHEGNDRLEATIDRLMTTLVSLRDSSGMVRTKVQLLGGNTRDWKSGMLRYNFDEKLISILQDSIVFGQLRKDVMFAFESKYALALYEIGEKRRNLSFKSSEDFTLPEIRDLLGVPSKKLRSFGDLNAYALKPAQLEVNALADFGIKLEPVREGRKVTKVRMMWWKKNEEELKAAWQELRRPRVGRKARMTGTVEEIRFE